MLENDHPGSLGAGYQRHIVDEDHYQVPGYRGIDETVREKSVESIAGLRGAELATRAADVAMRVYGGVGFTKAPSSGAGRRASFASSRGPTGFSAGRSPANSSESPGHRRRPVVTLPPPR